MVSCGIVGEKCDGFKGMKGVDIGECIGVSVSLDAILIIRDGETTIMKLRGLNDLDDILSCIPDRVGKFNINKENIKEEINLSS
ncbi:putative spore protein YtfJ [Clostridium beijerinckii]|nr:putative spore protein YtfJ [Clostridium beijerinckii]NOV68775.1 putative spore protein YtfJ [Clostridium beijerinckii]NOW35112.1 putative spore protein YtfJ [Clostridium beijerinckii]NOW87733.1 putative spore protein YtfJ [Clostridium beijerinckii]